MRTTLVRSLFSGTGTPACAQLLSRDTSDLGFRTKSHPMNARGQAEACSLKHLRSRVTSYHSQVTNPGAHMPNYNTQNPPYSIFPGDVALAFNSEAPAAGQASQQFALPNYAGRADNSRTVRWQTIFGTAPSAISVVLQSAMIDADAQYSTIDTSTVTTGEARSVTAVRSNFLRAKITSITGGSGITVQVLG
jgi:hypothetical protein